MTGRCRSRRRCRCKSFVFCFLSHAGGALGASGPEGRVAREPGPRPAGGGRRDWGASCFLTRPLPHFPWCSGPTSPTPSWPPSPAGRGLPLPGEPGTQPRYSRFPAAAPRPKHNPSGGRRGRGALLPAGLRAPPGAFCCSCSRPPSARPGCPSRAPARTPFHVGGCCSAGSKPGLERGAPRFEPLLRRPERGAGRVPSDTRQLPRRSLAPVCFDGICTRIATCVLLPPPLPDTLCFSDCRPAAAPLMPWNLTRPAFHTFRKLPLSR